MALIKSYRHEETPGERAGSVSKTPSRSRRWMVLLLVFFSTAAGWAIMGTITQGYSVEARLVYLYEPSCAADLEREISMLTNPQVLVGTAKEFSSERSNVWRDNRDLTIRPAMATQATVTDSPTMHNAGDRAAGFLQWFTHNLAVVPEFSPGMAKVTLSLQGKDPKFLKLVLDAYLNRYADWRRNLEASPDRSSFRFSDQQRAFSPRTAEAGTVSQQLQQIQFQKWNLELALKLQNSTKNPFAGFLPASDALGVSFLNRFQEKIAELEIKKSCLAVRFMPSSPEIREVDLEIQAVKTAMRSCIIENLRFLKEGGEFLNARQQQPEFQQRPAIMNTTIPPSEGMPWFVVTDGIYVMREGPDVTSQPLHALVAAGGKRLVAWWRSPPKATLASQEKGLEDKSVVLAGGTGEIVGAQ